MDESEGTRHEVRGKMPRRTAIASIAGGLLTLFGRHTASAQTESRQKSVEPIKPVVVSPESVKSQSEPIQPVQPIQPEYPPYIPLGKYVMPETVSLYFSGRLGVWRSDSDELDNGMRMLDKQIDGYLDQEGIDKQVLSVRKFEPFIMLACDGIQGIDPRVKDLMFGLIFVESKGNPNATIGNPNTKGLPNEIRGLCQMKVSTADEAFELLKKRESPLVNSVSWKSEKLADGKLRKFLDLSDPQTNIILATTHLNRLIAFFPDPGMAMWSYHFGEGNTAEVLNEYAKDKYGQSKQVDINHARDFIYDSGVSYLGLVSWFQSHYSKIGYKKNRLDDTEQYTLRAAAGAWLVRNFERGRLKKAA